MRELEDNAPPIQSSQPDNPLTLGETALSL